jgi:TraM recognition site of TraD and TraG
MSATKNDEPSFVQLLVGLLCAALKIGTAPSTSTDSRRMSKGLLARIVAAILGWSTRTLHVTDSGLLIGVATGGEVRVPYSLSEGSRYVVVGAAGFGKTVTLTGLFRAPVMGGAGLIFVDPKGDPAVLVALERLAERTKKKLIIWTPEGLWIYNPYGSGTPTEIADKLLCGEVVGTHPYFLKIARWYLAHVIRVMQACEIELNLRSIVRYMEPSRLRATLDGHERPKDGEYSKEYWDEVKNELKSISREEEKDFNGTRRRLAGLAKGDFGRWLDPRETGGESFDLLNAARAGHIVYFRLDSDNRALESMTLGGAIVQDINTVVGHFQGEVREGKTPRPLMIAIDEFGAVDADVSRVFERARSANVSIVIATQTFHTDMNKYEGQRARLTNNRSALIALAQPDPESALDVAEVGGKEEYWRETHHDGGSVTKTLDEKFRVTPDEIEGLERGQAMVSITGRSAQERALMVRLNSPRQIEQLRYA